MSNNFRVTVTQSFTFDLSTLNSYDREVYARMYNNVFGEPDADFSEVSDAHIAEIMAYSTMQQVNSTAELYLQRADEHWTVEPTWL
jgi:hypothetical protein